MKCYPMAQFVVWSLRGVRYIGLRVDDSAFLEQSWRLPDNIKQENRKCIT